jgi:hypothetical protein
MSKPLLKRANANWSSAFHGISIPFDIDPELLLIHLKYFDLPSLAGVAEARHQVHLEEGRGHDLSAWALDAQELSDRVRSWVSVPEGKSVPELEPKSLDTRKVVKLNKRGIYRATGPQLAEMDKNELMRLPERYLSAF